MPEYSENKKQYNMKYARDNLKRVPLDLQKDYYNNVLVPAAAKCGESVNGFIKKAIQDRIEKEA